MPRGYEETGSDSIHLSASVRGCYRKIDIEASSTYPSTEIRARSQSSLVVSANGCKVER